MPIDAPFNIMGMPAYIGYYITHNWEKGYMTFAPHTNSNKPMLEAGSVPKKELRVKYESENTPNGERWAFVIALIITVLCPGFYLFLYRDATVRSWNTT